MTTYAEMMQMCRLCLVKEQVNLPIFDGQGEVQQIFLKITACLPVKVSREDNLPKNICDGCSYKLDLLYQFWNTSSNSEKQLIDWLTAAGVEPKQKSNEPIGLATQPNVILKQEPVTDLDARSSDAIDAISSDTQNYIIQQQQLAYKPEEYDESQQNLSNSTKKKAAADPNDESVSKRPRRSSSYVSTVKDYEDDSDEDYVDNTDAGIAKTEDESEEDDDDEDEDLEDEGDDMADPDFVAKEEEEDSQQPGPSGTKTTSGPEIDDMLTPIVTISEVKKKKRGRPRKSDAEKQAAKDAKHEVKKSKAKSRMHSCEVCGKRFKTNQLMKQHVANFHSNIYNCNECSESFNTPLEYSIHIRMHTEDTHSKFQCVLCDYETPHIEELKNHLKKCSDRAPRFTCTICKKGFNVRTWYLEHANYHTGDKPFVCEICGKAFIYSRYLSAHRSTQHKFNGEEKKLHHCTLCDKVYQHRNSLAIHMNTHTGNGAVCDICGKLLSSKEKLKFHMRIHSGYKPFKCTYCEKAFIKKTILVEHIRIHTGEKPYRCEYCHKCFSQRSSMVTHVRGHTGERPHVCHFCGKGFVAKAMLNLHFKTCKGYNYPPQQ